MKKKSILKRVMAISCATAVMLTYTPAIAFAGEDVPAVSETAPAAAQDVAPAPAEAAAPAAPAEGEQQQLENPAAPAEGEQQQSENPAAPVEGEQQVPAADGPVVEQQPATPAPALGGMTSVLEVGERIVEITREVETPEIAELTVDYNTKHDYDKAIRSELGIDKKAKVEITYASKDGYVLDAKGLPIRAGEYTVSVDGEEALILTIDEIHSLKGLKNNVVAKDGDKGSKNALCTFSGQMSEEAGGWWANVTKGKYFVVDYNQSKMKDLKTTLNENVKDGMASGAYINSSVVDYYINTVFATLDNRESEDSSVEHFVCTDQDIVEAMLNRGAMEEDNFDFYVLKALGYDEGFAATHHLNFTEITEREIHFNAREIAENEGTDTVKFYAISAGLERPAAGKNAASYNSLGSVANVPYDTIRENILETADTSDAVETYLGWKVTEKDLKTIESKVIGRKFVVTEERDGEEVAVVRTAVGIDWYGVKYQKDGIHVDGQYIFDDEEYEFGEVKVNFYAMMPGQTKDISESDKEWTACFYNVVVPASADFHAYNFTTIFVDETKADAASDATESYLLDFVGEDNLAAAKEAADTWFANWLAENELEAFTIDGVEYKLTGIDWFRAKGINANPKNGKAVDGSVHVDGEFTFEEVVANNDDPGEEVDPEDKPEEKKPAKRNRRTNDTVISDGEVPLAELPTDISDGEVPLADLPGDMTEEEIPEDEVPLAELPQTGGIGAGIFLLAGGAIAAAGVGFRKREDEE